MTIVFGHLQKESLSREDSLELISKIVELGT
jgi:hypothetical protein